ncbi:MAG: RluA family pseudouridine synthase [Clostridia bacterium]|nr:RluA family pseudouridine synthase [Clostridia bacterium]
MDFIIPASYEGHLLRSYLLDELQLSARLLSALKQHPSGILLDGERVTVRAKLHSGAHLQLAIESITPTHVGCILPAVPSIPLQILYEDDDVTVCAKPAGMPTHPSHGHFTDTLANALAHRELMRTACTTGNKPFVFHPISRLDRNTSGTVLVARHALAAHRLCDAMMAGDIHKTYLALLLGVPAQRKGDIITGIRRREQSVITREITDVGAAGADRAHTRYEVLSTFPAPAALPLPPAYRDARISLVRAHPLTGRTHQLRLHFAHIGAPILGDELYGAGNLPLCMERHALHSLALSFPHPRTGNRVEITAPLPDDMRAWLPSDTALDMTTVG